MININNEFCPQNHICPVIRVCPVNAIYQATMFSAPLIDEKKCTGCGKCTKMCRVFSSK